jgi:hypothetical protein
MDKEEGVANKMSSQGWVHPTSDQIHLELIKKC